MGDKLNLVRSRLAGVELLGFDAPAQSATPAPVKQGSAKLGGGLPKGLSAKIAVPKSVSAKIGGPKTVSAKLGLVKGVSAKIGATQPQPPKTAKPATV